VDWSWRFRVLQAQILILQSQIPEALSLLQADLPPSLASTDVAVRKEMLEGIAYRVTQNFGVSESKLANAEALATSSQPQLLTDVLNAEGALQVDERKYLDAGITFHRALTLARQQKNPRQQATAMGNLGRLASSRERFDEAIDWDQSALNLASELSMHGTAAAIRGNLGWSYFQLGDFEISRDLYKQGAEESKRSDLRGYMAYWFTGVANTYMALHDYTSAEALSKETLELARSLHNTQTIALCLNSLSEIMLRTDRADQAEQYVQEALELEKEGLDHFSTLESMLISGRVEMSRHRLGQAEELLERIIQDPNAESPLKWEAEADLAGLKDQQGLITQADRGYRKAIERIELSRSSINHEELRMSFLSVGIDVYADYIDFLIRHNRSAEALRQAELSRARTLAEGLAPAGEKTSFALRHVTAQQTGLKLKATLLFYWIGQKNSYLWVITSAKTSYFKLPPASVIDPVLADYRKSLLRMHDAQDEGSAQGRKLYAMLVEPTKKLIPPGSQVIVLPSESLYGLNFETLIVPDPQPHFWIEDVTLRTGSSLTMLAASAAPPSPKDESLFLVGDTKPPNPPFAPLPQAAEEMKQVRKYFPGAQTRVLEGASATPSAVLKSNPEQFSYLHFVTHGTASHTRPLESAVILSPEGDSYKLYARDIVQHRLNANLVTISACNGAGTRAYSGEGLVGLSWAFLRAGAHNVIGALWEVSDASTPQLMDAFYRELFQGKDPATALRDAKLGLLHSADPDSVFKNPFYWAPFQLYAGS
jgi:CHAT domain-containing protein/tetratricopeptide (TPR) repeat protein